MTIKYLAILLRAEHPRFTPDDDWLNVADDNDVVGAYVIRFFSTSLEAMTSSQVDAAIEKSETLEDFDDEFLKYAPADA